MFYFCVALCGTEAQRCHMPTVTELPVAGLDPASKIFQPHPVRGSLSRGGFHLAVVLLLSFQEGAGNIVNRIICFGFTRADFTWLTNGSIIV